MKGGVQIWSSCKKVSWNDSKVIEDQVFAMLEKAISEIIEDFRMKDATLDKDPFKGCLQIWDFVSLCHIWMLKTIF